MGRGGGVLKMWANGQAGNSHKNEAIFILGIFCLAPAKCWFALASISQREKVKRKPTVYLSSILLEYLMKKKKTNKHFPKFLPYKFSLLFFKTYEGIFFLPDK